MDKRVLILTETAVAVAMALALSQLRLFRLPQAGSVTLAMVPLVVIAYRWGPKAGIMAGVVLGLLRLTLDAYVVHWAQFILDYPLAFALVALAGFFPSRKIIGVVIGYLGRFACHFLSGVIFFAEFAPEGTPVALYSIIYNMGFIIPEAIITVAVLVWLFPRLQDALPPHRYAR